MLLELLAILAPAIAIGIGVVQLWRLRGRPLLPAPPRAWFWAAVAGCVTATAAVIGFHVARYLTIYANPPTLSDHVSELLMGLMIVILGGVFIRQNPSYRFTALFMWCYAIMVSSMPLHSYGGGWWWHGG
jgi:hypothetical protein